jgi:hypothetical protein
MYYLNSAPDTLLSYTTLSYLIKHNTLVAKWSRIAATLFLHSAHCKQVMSATLPFFIHLSQAEKERHFCKEHTIDFPR